MKNQLIETELLNKINWRAFEIKESGLIRTRLRPIDYQAHPNNAYAFAPYCPLQYLKGDRDYYITFGNNLFGVVITDAIMDAADHPMPFSRLGSVIRAEMIKRIQEVS